MLSNFLYTLGWVLIIAAFVFASIMISFRKHDPGTDMFYDFLGFPADDDLNIIFLLFTIHGWLELVGFWGGISLGYYFMRLSEKFNDDKNIIKEIDVKKYFIK